ncbi:MAG TPA: hypothetical protein DHV28_01830 [Ignavibacteriales bacterium]|nr:hypothetical protein [Ignavibacteriales bacterium]
MKKIIFTSILLIATLTYFFWPEKVISYPSGQVAPDQPIQQNLSLNKVWKKNEFNIKALAEYKIKARVLSRNDFSIGRESEISPVDFALGWGPMSDQDVIDKIEITQSNRWYHWKTDSYPIPQQEISLNSANVHIIPKDDLTEEKIKNVYKGSLVEMKGYLVEVTVDDGWHWKSSLRRDDTAGGSCELFWVEELTILDNE